MVSMNLVEPGVGGSDVGEGGALEASWPSRRTDLPRALVDLMPGVFLESVPPGVVVRRSGSVLLVLIDGRGIGGLFLDRLGRVKTV